MVISLTLALNRRGTGEPPHSVRGVKESHPTWYVGGGEDRRANASRVFACDYFKYLDLNLFTWYKNCKQNGLRLLELIDFPIEA